MIRTGGGQVEKEGGRGRKHLCFDVFIWGRRVCPIIFSVAPE